MQRQQRPLAAVQRDHVDEVEQARLGQLAQLGVDEAAAQRDGDGRIVRLDRLRDAQRAVHRAGEGHRQQHQRGRWRAISRAQALQRAIDQVGWRKPRLRQRLEAGLAGGELLGVAHELEARVDGVAQHVGQSLR